MAISLGKKSLPRQEIGTASSIEHGKQIKINQSVPQISYRARRGKMAEDGGEMNPIETKRR